MTRKMVWVVAMLALAGCVDPNDVAVWQTFSADDPRVGSYRGAFDGCLKTVGNAYLRIADDGGAFFDTSFDGVETGSQFHEVMGASPTVQFREERGSLEGVTAYDVSATLSEDGQRITGSFTVTYTPDGQPAMTPDLCQLAVAREPYDPKAVDPRAAEFTCSGPAVGMDLPDDAPMWFNTPSPSAPVPSCFSGPYYAGRFRPPSTGTYDVSGIVPGASLSRPIAVFSSCTGRELACSANPDPDSAQGIATLGLMQFEDVLIVSAGELPIAAQVSLHLP